MGDNDSSPDTTTISDSKPPTQSRPSEGVESVSAANIEPSNQSAVNSDLTPTLKDSPSLSNPGSSDITSGQLADENKIIVLLKNVGDAPILRRNKFKLEPAKNISYIVDFIKKVLRTESNQSIFIYINQSFAPSLDQTIQNLYDCYACDKKLVLHYAITPAWG